MLEQMIMMGVARYVMFVFLGVGMLCELLVGCRVASWLRQQQKYGVHNTELGANIRKYVVLGKKHGCNVNNVDKFVDKYVYKQKIMGIRLCTWEKCCGQLKTITGLFAVISILSVMMASCGKERIVKECIFCAIMLTMWISTYIFVNRSGSILQIRENSVEYLENQLLPLLADQHLEENLQAFLAEEKQVKKKEKEGKDKGKGKDFKRQEMERVKKDLVEELKRERKKRERKKREEEEDTMVMFESPFLGEESKTREKKEKNITAGQLDDIAKSDAVNMVEESERIERKREERESKALTKLQEQLDESEKDSRILREILKEYLGEA